MIKTSYYDCCVWYLIFSITSNQILSTGGFKFFLSRLSHWLFQGRVNTSKVLVAGPVVNRSIYYPIHSIPKMLLPLSKTKKNCFWVSNRMCPLGCINRCEEGVARIIYKNHRILLASYHKSMMLENIDTSCRLAFNGGK